MMQVISCAKNRTFTVASAPADRDHSHSRNSYVSMVKYGDLVVGQVLSIIILIIYINIIVIIGSPIPFCKC